MADETAPPAPPKEPSTPESEARAAPPAGPPSLSAPAGASRPRPLQERKGKPDRGPRPELSASREPLFRETRGYTLRLDPPDLAKMKELPGSRGKTERELGEEFFDAYAERFAAALVVDVSAPAVVRVVVDPFSRQAFLAVGGKITAILSF